jgi:GxxExxY protein
MKIVFIAADTNKIGGIEKYNKEFISALREAGVDVAFVPLRGIEAVQKLLFILRVFWRAFSWKPDFICCSHVAFSPICYFIKKILRIDYSVNIYGIEIAEIKSKFHKKALKSAKFIINLFDQAAKNVARQIPETADKFINLPNFVDGEKFYIKEKSRRLIRKHGLENSKIILTVCRLSRSEVDNKGYEKVIRAMSGILEKIPDAKYLLVGGGDDAERVKNIVKQSGLENKVILSGPVKDEDLADYYNLADVLAFPSKREGFPAFVLIEALACGKPVIGGRQGEPSEERVFNGKLGYVIDPDSPRELEDAIVKILSGTAPDNFFNPHFVRESILAEYGKGRHKERVKEFIGLLNIPKLAVVMSHAIQYQTPLLKKIASSGKIDLNVYFNWGFGVNQKITDPEFGKKIRWDIPILEGYKYKFLKNYSPRPSSGFLGQLNFGIVWELAKKRYDAVLIYGWNSFANWLVFLMNLIIGVSIVLQGESPLNQELLKSGLKQKIKKIILSKIFFPRISAFLYIGEENRKFYRYYGVPDKKLFFTPYAVENSRFIKKARNLKSQISNLKNSIGIDVNNVVILFVGKLIEKKRPMDLLKAFETITRNIRMSPNMPNKIVEKELSYELTGVFFEIQNELGRFARERQYADAFEEKLKKRDLEYKREFVINVAGRKSNFADFIIENKILVELKRKPVNTRDDYKQIMRYLESVDLELGLLINFGLEYLKPKRILNPKFNNRNPKYPNASEYNEYKKVYSVNSDKFVNSGCGIHLLFVGDGALRPELEKYAKEHNLKNVIFVGFKNQTELPDYYAMADVFVLPSGEGETWGLVVNKAMCFGLPVIVSDIVGCGPDLVKHGENGYIFPLGNIEKLAEYLGELVKKPARIKTFGKKSFEIVKNYTHERGIEGILTALNSIKK